MNNDVTLGPIPYNFHQLVLISIVKYSDIFANYVETQDLDFDNHLECILNEQIICGILYLYLYLPSPVAGGRLKNNNFTKTDSWTFSKSYN